MAAAATPRIIVVGGCLAGLSAVIKIAEAGARADLQNAVTNSITPDEVP